MQQQIQHIEVSQLMTVYSNNIGFCIVILVAESTASVLERTKNCPYWVIVGKLFEFRFPRRPARKISPNFERSGPKPRKLGFTPYRVVGGVVIRVEVCPVFFNRFCFGFFKRESLLVLLLLVVLDQIIRWNINLVLVTRHGAYTKVLLVQYHSRVQYTVLGVEVL